MRILIVDDDTNSLKAIERVLTANFDCTVDAYDSSEEAFEQIQKALYDIIISDFRMPKIDGITLLSKSKNVQPMALRVILSGYCDREALSGAINTAQVQKFIEKPYQPQELISVVNEILEERIELYRGGRIA